MKRVILFPVLVLICVFIFSCEGENNLSPEKIDTSNFIQIVNLSSNWDSDRTIYYNYDEVGRLTYCWGRQISYTTIDKTLCKMVLVEGNNKIELTINNNLCTSASFYWETEDISEKHDAINHYSNGRISSRQEKIQRKDFDGSYAEECVSSFTWKNDNLISWTRNRNTGFSWTLSYDYYDYLNPWANSLYDITTAYFLELDRDDLLYEMELGLIGKHSKNLIKASYHNGVLYQTFQYEFDEKGRVSKITVKRDRNYAYAMWGHADEFERWWIYDIVY